MAYTRHHNEMTVVGLMFVATKRYICEDDCRTVWCRTMYIAARIFHIPVQDVQNIRMTYRRRPTVGPTADAGSAQSTNWVRTVRTGTYGSDCNSAGAVHAYQLFLRFGCHTYRLLCGPCIVFQWSEPNELLRIYTYLICTIRIEIHTIRISSSREWFGRSVNFFNMLEKPRALPNRNAPYKLYESTPWFRKAIYRDSYPVRKGCKSRRFVTCYGRPNGRTDGPTDEQTNERTNERVEARTYERTNKRMDRRQDAELAA